MRISELTLFKAPFTPTYQNLVSGCNSRELYDKMLSELEHLTYTTTLNQSQQFRTVRETVDKLEFTINIDYYYAAHPPVLFKLDQCNYVGIIENGSEEVYFYFIDDYTVINNLNGINSYHVYCTKDFWHTYMTDATFDNCNIVRATQKYNSNSNFIPDERPTEHINLRTIGDRVIWLKLKFNGLLLPEIEVEGGGALGIGTSMANPSMYIPLFVIREYGSYQELKYISQIATKKDSATFVNTLELFAESIGIETSIQRIRGEISDRSNFTLRSFSNIFTIIKEKLSGSLKGMYLTYFPPFNFDFYESTVNIYLEDNISVNNDFVIPSIMNIKITDGDTNPSLTGIVNFTRSSGQQSGHPIDNKDNKIISVSYTPNKSFSSPLNAYPYNYASVMVGGKEYNVNYPVQKVDCIFYHNFSEDGATYDLFINSKLIASKILVNDLVPIDFVVSNADSIDAIYGSSYRAIQLEAENIREVTNVVRSIANIKPSPEGAFIGAMTFLGDAAVSGLNIATNIMEYNAQDRIVANENVGTNNSGVMAIGYYPYIIYHNLTNNYYDYYIDFIKCFGTRCLIYGSPIVKYHTFFDYVKCEGYVNSVSCPQIYNKDLIQVLTGGTTIWYYDSNFAFRDFYNKKNKANPERSE